MANKIIHKHNKETIPAVPALSSLEIGELAIDNISGKLYTRKGTNVTSDIITEISGSGGTTGGGIHSLPYIWHTAIDTSPANGVMTADNATMASITKLYVNKVDSSGNDKSLFLQDIEVGTELIVHDHSDSDINMVFSVSNLPTLTGNAFTIPVTFVSQKGTDFTNKETVNLHWNASETGSAKRYEFYTDATHLRDFLLDEPLSANALVSVNGNTVSEKDYEANGNNIRFLITLRPNDFIVVLNNAPSSSGGGGGSSTFIDLTDTPTAYVADQGVYVNAAGDGLEFKVGVATPSTGLEKVTVSGKTGMRVIGASDASINTNSLNLDVTATVTDIGTNSIAIGARPTASGDASIAIGSSHGVARIVAKAPTSVIIGAATAGNMIIEEGSLGSVILGGKNIKIDRFHPYTAVIAGENITTKQKHTVYIPTLKFKGYDTNDIVDRTGAESGTMMYDQQRRIFMRYTGDDWHTESPSGLEHVVEDIYMAPMVGAGVSGSTTFTSGGVEDQTAILVAGLEVFTFALTNGTHIHTKVVSSSLNTAGHTVVIVEDAFPYDMIVLSYPAAPAQNGWNFHRTPATTTGDDAVNLMSSGDASQANMVYVSGVKYKSYTTAEIAIFPDSELGTVVFDSSQNKLSQCTDATPGANVWSSVGGDLSQIHQELRKEFSGTLVAGTIPAYTFTIDAASGDVTSQFPDNAIFILGGGGLMAAPYTVGTATFVGGSTVINFVNPYPNLIPAFTKILADDNWGWKLGDTSLQLTGSGSVNLLGAGMGDATQPNITYVGGIKYTSYTTVQINALPGTEAGTVVYDSDKNKLQYYNGTAWSDLGGEVYTPKRFEALATTGQTIIMLSDDVRDAATVNINGATLMSNKYSTAGKTITLNTGLSKDNEIIVTNMGGKIPPPTVSGRLASGSTGFLFESDAGEEFTVEQGGVVQVLTGNGTTAVSVTGLDDASDVTIKLTGANTFFDFKDNWKSLNIKDIGSITTLRDSFRGLVKMTTFECDADLSKVTNFDHAWNHCQGLTTFPVIDTSSGTNFTYAWNHCIGLTSFPELDFSKGVNFADTWNGSAGIVCFDGTINFSSLTNGYTAFRTCTALTQPAIGSTVRGGGTFGDDALQGTWTNTSPCP